MTAPALHYSEKIIHLTPLKESQGNISPQDLVMLLAAMTQVLLTDMSKTAEALAQQAEANAQVSQLEVGAANTQSQEALADQQKLQAEQNQTVWQQIANICTKYVLPALMCVAAAAIFGPAAGLIAGAIFLATAVPIHDGKSLVSLASSGIAEGLGKDFGWSPGVIQLVQGVLNVAIAVGLAVIGGAAASAGTVGEAVEESAVESTLQTNAGRFTAFNAFSSTTANTNSWYDISFGIGQLVDKNSKDQDTIKNAAQIISTILNVVVALASMKGTYSAFSEGIALSSGGSMMIQKALTSVGYVTTGASASSTIAEGVQNQSLEDLTATITQKMGSLNFIEGVDHISSQNSNSVNAALKNALSQYATMLGNNPNYASVDLTEAKELSICNNRV